MKVIKKEVKYIIEFTESELSTMKIVLNNTIARFTTLQPTIDALGEIQKKISGIFDAV